MFLVIFTLYIFVGSVYNCNVKSVVGKIAW